MTPLASRLPAQRPAAAPALTPAPSGPVLSRHLYRSRSPHAGRAGAGHARGSLQARRRRAAAREGPKLLLLPPLLPLLCCCTPAAAPRMPCAHALTTHASLRPTTHPQLDGFLENMLRSRISRRVMAEQHITLTSQRPGYIGAPALLGLLLTLAKPQTTWARKAALFTPSTPLALLPQASSAPSSTWRTRSSLRPAGASRREGGLVEGMRCPLARCSDLLPCRISDSCPTHLFLHLCRPLWSTTAWRPTWW